MGRYDHDQRNEHDENIASEYSSPQLQMSVALAIFNAGSSVTGRLGALRIGAITTTIHHRITDQHRETAQFNLRYISSEIWSYGIVEWME